MTNEQDGARQGPLVVVDEDGKRLVRWSRSGSGGVEYIIEHDFPDALRHHYEPGGVDEEVPLYQGSFRLDDDKQPFEGDVRFSWLPSPGVEARGFRQARIALEELGRVLASDAEELWVEPSRVHIALDDGRLPDQPPPGHVAPEGAGHRVSRHIEQEVGTGVGIDRVTFLLPNGWQAHDGLRICDPDDLAREWPGRIETDGDGWAVTIDRVAGMSHPDEWRELRDTGGRRFTHVGCLARQDGAPFTGQDAFEILDRVRVALNLAMGRRTTCSLPVGWRGDDPVWTLWRSAPVDPYAGHSDWLDATIAAHQVGEIVGLALGADPMTWSVIRAAVAYLMAASVDVEVELAVSIPVSGLQLLAYYRFVTQTGQYSKGKWDDLSTEEQLRLLLDEVNADLTVQPHFAHLGAVQARLALNAPPRDALGVVMKMRNIVTHPTRDKPADMSIYEWAEAGMHARYWLCLAILNTVHYGGQIAETLGPTVRWTGRVRSVPWAAPA